MKRVWQHLPDYVIDAIASNITVCRSTTCSRIGRHIPGEGTFDQRGCCEGSCTHVWNCARPWHSVPDLEQSEKVEFNLETGERKDVL